MPKARALTLREFYEFVEAEKKAKEDQIEKPIEEEKKAKEDQFAKPMEEEKLAFEAEKNW